MKKLILATVSCVVLLCLLCSCGLIGGSKLAFTEKDGEYVCSGLGDSTDAEVVVPEKYKGKAVTAIGDRAFYFNFMSSVFSQSEAVKITSVTLPETIESIGAEAFANNKQLTSVNIPDSVKTIGASAFFDCAALKSITIPDGVTEIKDYTFYGCTSLESITIPDSVTKIGKNAFQNCTSLKNIKLPEAVIEISDKCFSGCSSLVDFPVNDKTVTIGHYAFEKCSSLGEVTIPSTVITLGENVFSGVGETVTVNVNYDSTAPANWNEKWYAGMGGGKAINTSEAYYNAVVTPNLTVKADLEKKIQGCKDQYQSLKESITAANSRITTIRSNPFYSPETINNLEKPIRQEIRSYQEQQSRVLEQQKQYEEQLSNLKLSAQLN